MLRIGLTGGIAAGKSTVAAMLRERGAVVIDHDEIAREVVAPGTLGLDRVVERFGEGVLAPDGSLDRAALGHIVFNDLQARADLGALLHPEIARVSAEREAMVVAADGDALVVHDIPLLVETGQGEAHHIVVVVHAPADLRIRRLVEERGSSLPDARRRIAAQATDEERAAAADVLIDGAGSVDDLRAQVDELWDRLQAELAEERG